MTRDDILKKYTFGDYFKWLDYSNPINALSDYYPGDEEAKLWLNKSLYSMKDLVMFDDLNIDAFIQDKQMEKLSIVTLPLVNPITEKMENYILDYDGKNFIILEPRETEAKEFELCLDEPAFIDYLKEKGEDPFTAQEIADTLKEEKKMATLLKVSEDFSMQLYVDNKPFDSIKEAATYIVSKLNLSVDFLTNIKWDDLNNTLSIKNKVFNVYWFDGVDYKEPVVLNEKLQMDNAIVNALKEKKSKMASLLKLAKQEDIAFDANAFMRVWVDITDLEYEPEIENIKKMNIFEDEKIKLAKEFAKQIAVNKISNNDVQIKGYDDLEQTFDRIDWVKLIEEESSDI